MGTQQPPASDQRMDLRNVVRVAPAMPKATDWPVFTLRVEKKQKAHSAQQRRLHEHTGQSVATHAQATCCSKDYTQSAVQKVNNTPDAMTMQHTALDERQRLPEHTGPSAQATATCNSSDGRNSNSSQKHAVDYAAPPATDKRLAALESGIQQILSALHTIQTDVLQLKQQAVLSPFSTSSSTELSTTNDGLLESDRVAQERLEGVIRRTYTQFSKHDADESGCLDVAELTKAMNALGSMPGEVRVTESECAIILSAYDEDGSSTLGRDEFTAFITDLVTSGKFVFCHELQADIEQISGRADDPWAAAKNDREVLHMMEALRFRDHRNVGRASLRLSSRSHQRTKADDERGLGTWRARVFNRCCCLFPVINPDGRLRSGWNALMASLIIYCGIGVPLEVAFEVNLYRAMGTTGWAVWTFWNLSVDFAFIADIVLSFRTSFFVEGHLQRDGWLIAQHYLKGNFVVDLIGSFPLQLVLQTVSEEGKSDPTARLNRQLRLLRLFKLNRLLRLFRLAKKLKYLELLIKFNPSVLRVIKLIVFMMLICHWLGCAWWFVSDLELSATSTPTISQNSWQPSSELLSSELLGPQFAAAFFWGASMATAMLPYDVEPATEVEQYFTIFCMTLGLVLQAYVIGSVTSALSTMDSKKALASGKLDTISAYLQIHSVSPELKGHILEFYEYLYTSTQSLSDLHLYKDLPPALAMRLAISVHRRILARCPELRSFLSDSALLALLGRLKPRIYVPGQIIYSEGQELNALYFIKKGRVQFVKGVGSAHEVLKRMKVQHDNFGLSLEALSQRVEKDSSRPGPNSSFRIDAASAKAAATQLTVEKQAASEAARAETYCDLVSLDRIDLIAVINKDRLWSNLQRMPALSSPRRRSSIRPNLGGMKAGARAALFAKRLKGISSHSARSQILPKAAPQAQMLEASPARDA